MKIFVITEYQTDYDDYPIGSGKIVLVTISEDRAKKETGFNKSLWTKSKGFGKVSRRYSSHELEYE